MGITETVLAMSSLVAGTLLVRAGLPLWYRRAVIAQMEGPARAGAAHPRSPAAGRGAAAAGGIDLQEVAKGAAGGSSGEPERTLALVRAARRRRLVLRTAALILAPAVQAVLLLAWVEPARPGSPAITPRALLVAGLIAGVVPALLALRSLISYSQLSTIGSWWLLAVPVGAGLGADAWVTLSVLKDVRLPVALAAFAAVAAVCYVVLLLLLAALRMARRAVGLSSDGFSFLLAGALGALVVGIVFSGQADARAGLLLAAPLPIYAAAVLLPRALSRSNGAPRTLLFLRTFRGPRSLLPGLARHWLHVGEIQLLVGPDVATRTASAEGVLALVGGRLRRHFVASPDDLARRLTGARGRPARDGRYDVREFPCLGDAWQPTLIRLASEADAILLDLRGFHAANAGCVFELQTLAALGALARTLAVADPETDRAAARAALARGTGRAPGGQEAQALRIWSTAAEGAPDPGALFAALLTPGRAP